MWYCVTQIRNKQNLTISLETAPPTPPTTEKEDSDREWAVVGSDNYIRYGLK